MVTALGNLPAARGRRCGVDYLLLEVTLPEAYPEEPVFVRLVSPR